MDGKTETESKLNIEIQNYEAKPNNNNSNVTDFWLSMDIRLDDINYLNQTFTVTGWINAFWDLKSVNENYEEYFAKLPDKNGFELYYDSELSIYKYNICQIHASERDPCTLAFLAQKRKILEELCPFETPAQYNCIFNGDSVQTIKYLGPIRFFRYKVGDREVAKIQYYLSATLYEALELYQYPFDYQFLNLKISFKSWKFNLIRFNEKTAANIIEQYIPKKKRQKNYKKKNANNIIDKDRQLITIYLKESLADDVEMYPPWLDIRTQKVYKYRGWCGTKILDAKDVKYQLIRLRVSTNPYSIIIGTLLPFCGIVFLSFATFNIDATGLANRMGIQITLLLTFTAFQGAIKQHLPETSNILFIDIYIIMCYIIQILCIIETWALQVLTNDMDIITKDDQKIYDDITRWTLLPIFVLLSLYYMSFSFRKNWDKRAYKEMETFKARYESSNFHGIGLDLKKSNQEWKIFED